MKLVNCVEMAFLLALLVCSCGVIAQEREVIFSDDFSGYADGADLNNRWSVFSGNWQCREAALHQEAVGYDHGIAARDLYLDCDYRIEARVKLPRATRS